jgi:hypothetical protein
MVVVAFQSGDLCRAQIRSGGAVQYIRRGEFDG